MEKTPALERTNQALSSRSIGSIEGPHGTFGRRAHISYKIRVHAVTSLTSELTLLKATCALASFDVTQVPYFFRLDVGGADLQITSFFSNSNLDSNTTTHHRHPGTPR